MSQAHLFDVVGDGNCFFYSLFGAASAEPGMLQRLAECFHIDDKTCWENIHNVDADVARSMGLDKLFMSCVREAIARYLENPENAGSYLGGAYETMDALREDPDTLEQVLSNLSSWMVKAFRDSHDKRDFIERCVMHVRMDGEWVNQIEVQTVVDMVDKESNGMLQVYIATDSVKPEDVPNLNTGRAPTDPYVITLYCKSNTHYNYIIYEQVGGRKMKRITPKRANMSNEKY